MEVSRQVHVIATSLYVYVCSFNMALLKSLDIKFQIGFTGMLYTYRNCFIKKSQQAALFQRLAFFNYK